ncbi:MAG: M50 family metallopeptidase [bacterium]
MIFIIVVSILFWDSYLIYPIKLFVVLFHEISHGLAGFITGGKITHIQIDYELGGLCVVEGGNTILIAFSGYLGSLLFGGLLYYTSFDKKKLIITTTILAVLLLIMTANFIKGGFGVLFSVLFIILLITFPRLLNYTYNKFIFRTIGIISCLYVLTDIKEDLFTITYRQTDAQILSDLLGVHPLMWGLLWLGISTAFVYYLIKHMLKKD